MTTGKGSGKNGGTTLPGGKSALLGESDAKKGSPKRKSTRRSAPKDVTRQKSAAKSSR